MMSEENTESLSAPKRKRRRRQARFKMPPRVALPVRGLWESAGEEEQKKAHQAGVAILELWLGQTTRQEVAERLQVPPLRVWQLSQQALSGLVAGLLKQPKVRAKTMGLPLEERPWKLKGEITKLEREVESLKSLVRLLRDLPANREYRKPKEVKLVRTRRGRRKNAQGAQAEDRPATGQGGSRPKRARSRGSSVWSDGADGAELDEGVERTRGTSGPSAAQ
jgi:hypothetical protein